MSLRPSRRLAVLSAILVPLLLGCPQYRTGSRPDLATPSPSPVSGPCRESTTLPNQTSPEIDCAAPPSTFESAPIFANTPAQTGPTFDSWAWASFAAMNWPAQASSSQPSGYLRGIPDTGKSFAAALPTDVLVWETFKEKREVFNSTVTAVSATTWQALTYPPDQEMEPAGSVPACSSSDMALMSDPKHRLRRVLQSSKLSPALGTGPNELDETAEVASPAQESQNALCAGYSGSALMTCTGLFPPPSGGSGSTVYPPTMVNSRPAVGPRVLDPNGNTVFYEVRVNYDYFDYVVTNGLNLDPLPATPAPPYSLPWRTSAQGPPGSGTQQTKPLTVNYDPNSVLTTYGTSPTTPPPVGSIQVKSAWMRVTDKTPNPSQFHLTEAVYFDNQTSGALCYRVGLFALIGLHIIQRVHMGDSNDMSADPLGGTFIFATWEHNSIASGGGYSYVNFLASATNANTPYPALTSAIPVTRQQSYPLATTAAATSGVYSQLPASSVWRNYRLIGTQFYTNTTAGASESTYNQPFYLANLVVETNNGLQNFQGLPPNVTPVSTYSNPPNNTNSFNPGLQNVSYNGSPYNMGGCMGCHGVAQLKGSNFSFVLLDGQNGAGIDTQEDIDIPPQGPPPGTGGQ